MDYGKTACFGFRIWVFWDIQLIQDLVGRLGARDFTYSTGVYQCSMNNRASSQFVVHLRIVSWNQIFHLSFYSFTIEHESNG